MILGGSGRNLNYSGKFQYSHRILTVIRMTAQNLIQLCSSFCRKMMCMLGSKSTLHFERSDLVISLGKEILGEGGFSTVYKASDRKLSINAHYAVKKVLILNNEIKHSVIAEIEALNQFCHVNIIRLIDSTEGRNDSNMPVMYLLFPLLQRGTLRDILNSRLKNDPARVSLSLAPLIKDIVSILSAFNYMHTFSPVKYIHQDIKPENILISDDGTPLLADFGSVREAEVFIDSRKKALTISDEAAQFCTLPYRAPELFDPPTNMMLDSRTDVWGIGCLMFAWWYGYSPFECEFDRNDHVRVVECSYSRVLSKIPAPEKLSNNDNFILELVNWTLARELTCRPFCADIIERLDRANSHFNAV